MSLFNPRATMDIVRLDEEHFCLVIDDALSDPHKQVRLATERHAEFNAVDFSFYPGIYLVAPADLTGSLAHFFQFHARRHFDARRCLQTTCRYSMVTKPPWALRPVQWLCHRDDVGLDSRLSMQASVLYLFHDATLGGTAFYAPSRDAASTGQLFTDARVLAPADFAAKYALTPGYMDKENGWFRRIGSIEARWNRLIIYDGGMLHTGEITAPERLSPDPGLGRLTLNGFFTCRRQVSNSIHTAR